MTSGSDFRHSFFADIHIEANLTIMMRGELRLLVICMGLVAFSRITQGVDYALAFVKSVSYEGIQAVAGQTGGWVKFRQGSEMNVLSYSTRSHYLSDSELATSGIEQKSVIVTVIGKDVNIYGEYVYSTFNPLPILALGTRYIVSSCHPPNDVFDYTSVLVIATHGHKTDVDITFRLVGRLTYQNKTYSDGDILTLSLAEYQTFTIISDFDLTGTVVNSVQTVAVFSGTLCKDFIIAYDQLLPVQHYGQEYVVAVDDSSALYQLQIVSEQSGTKIMFNSGYTVSFAENGMHRHTLTQNSSLYFSSSRPVMATLCRSRMLFSNGFVVIPPVTLYTKQTILSYSRFKTLSVDEGDPHVRNRSTSSIPGQWKQIPGTGYKVGTWRDRSSVAQVSSNTGFVILAFGSSSIYHGGYTFGPSLFNLGQMYVAAFADDVHSAAYIRTVAGETGGWVNVQPGSERGVRSYRYEQLYISQSMTTKCGIKRKSILVSTVDGNINVYGEYTSSGFTLLPISALGTKYIVSSCHSSDEYTSVLVMATHRQKTDVDVTFRLEGSVTYDGSTYSYGDNLTLSLEEYETLTIRSDFDLSGTVVNSVNTLAIFSGTLYRDDILTYDQLLPVQHYGQEYVVAVDDNPALYQLQIVSDHSDTQIIFNNGSTVSVDESGLYRQTLTWNSSLHFSSSRPVMTTLCRGTGSSSGFVVIPPVVLYTKKAVLYRYDILKIVTVKEADILIRNRTNSTTLDQWEEIPGTGYKVGTWADNSGVLDVSSNMSFGVLAFYNRYIYSGGYNIWMWPSQTDNTTSADFTAASTCITSTTSQSRASTTNTLVTNIPTTNTVVDTTTRLSAITTPTTESNSKSTSHSNSNMSRSNSTMLTIVSAVCGVIIFLLLITIVILVIYIKATRQSKSETTSNRVISNVIHTDFTNAHYEDAVPNDQGEVFQQQDDQQVSRDTGNTYSDLSLYENAGDANQYEKLHVYGN